MNSVEVLNSDVGELSMILARGSYGGIDKVCNFSNNSNGAFPVLTNRAPTLYNAVALKSLKSKAVPRGKTPQKRTKPKRPLSAYNFFFHEERQNILVATDVRKEGKPRRSHGKIGFADLARKIAAKWKSLTAEERGPYNEKASADKKRYHKEMDVWKQEQERIKAKQVIGIEAAAISAGSGGCMQIYGLNPSNPHYSGLQPVISRSLRRVEMTNALVQTFDNTIDDTPLPFAPVQLAEQQGSVVVHQSARIASLASQLDSEETDMLLNLFNST